MPEISISFPPAGGAAASGNYTLISDQTATGAEGTITFSAIPATYKHLRLVVAAAGTPIAQALTMTVNGDSGANYDFTYLSLSPDLTWTRANQGGGTVNQTSARVGTTGGPGTPIAGEWTFANYAATGPATRAWTGMSQRSIGNAGTVQTVELCTGHLRGTAPVSSIALVCGTVPFWAGSRFTLYGLS